MADERYSLQDVSKAANAACDDVVQTISVSEDEVDVLNLLVNAVISYLEGTCEDLHEVAGKNYDDLRIEGGDLVWNS